MCTLTKTLLHPLFGLSLLVAMLLAAVACNGSRPAIEPLPDGLLLGYAIFDKDDSGKSVPQPARLGLLWRDESGWNFRTIEDPDSNVFHKAMVYEPAVGQPGILTLGGTAAIVKLWRPGESPHVLWEKDFGGKFSRMRDAEVADVYNDGQPTIVVATHDQGVVATVRPTPDGSYRVDEFDQEPDTFVHEIEIGDLDGDETLEIYATPSARNVLDGKPQPGFVARYVPAKGEGRVLVADLGDRHAKEILVGDVDGDGRDELYVSIEAVSGGKVEIRRYDAGTDPQAGALIAELDDKLCRFLTAGDVDGDGKDEMVAAASKSGLWLLRPGADPRAAWDVTSIDRDSSGFEHAAILSDLDGDGIDELYVASDRQAEIRRYVWQGGTPVKEVLHRFEGGLDGFTWNIMPAPVELFP